MLLKRVVGDLTIGSDGKNFFCMYKEYDSKTSNRIDLDLMRDLLRFLPAEGTWSKRRFAWWCASRCEHLNADGLIVECLEVCKQRVISPSCVSDQQLEAAHKNAFDAYSKAARDRARGAVALAAYSAAGVDIGRFAFYAATHSMSAIGDQEHKIQLNEIIMWLL